MLLKNSFISNGEGAGCVNGSGCEGGYEYQSSLNHLNDGFYEYGEGAGAGNSLHGDGHGWISVAAHGPGSKAGYGYGKGWAASNEEGEC